MRTILRTHETNMNNKTKQNNKRKQQIISTLPHAHNNYSHNTRMTCIDLTTHPTQPTLILRHKNSCYADYHYDSADRTQINMDNANTTTHTTNKPTNQELDTEPPQMQHHNNIIIHKSNTRQPQPLTKQSQQKRQSYIYIDMRPHTRTRTQTTHIHNS